LLLRLGVGIALIYPGMSRLFGTPGEPITAAVDFVEAAGGVFLLTGLWTPVMGALIAIDELWIALSLYSSEPDSRWLHIFLAVLTGGIAMLSSLSLEQLRALASAAPPCISIVILESEARDARIAFNDALAQIRGKLAASASKNDIASLLDPLEDTLRM
jgi:hypothetical protein